MNKKKKAEPSLEKSPEFYFAGGPGPEGMDLDEYIGISKPVVIGNIVIIPREESYTK